jgi:hypothetical protein
MLDLSSQILRRRHLCECSTHSCLYITAAAQVVEERASPSAMGADVVAVVAGPLG